MSRSGYTDENLETLTAEHMANPQPGDEFHEMFTLWVMVYARDGEKITVHEAVGPCVLPKDATVRVFDTVKDFQNAYAYHSIDGYWIMFNKNGSYRR